MTNGKHRRKSGKHRRPSSPKKLSPVPAIVLATAFATLVSAYPADSGLADFQPGAKRVVAEQLPRTTPPAPVVKQAKFFAPPERTVTVAAAMLVPTVPIEGANGLTQNARALALYISSHYPHVKSIGGVRSDPLPDHPSGHAIDLMVYGDAALGDTITADVLSQASRFGVKYVIWKETYRQPNGVHYWMSDRGSVTANHFDHVHVTVY